MFEVRLVEGSLLKKILESIKDLVSNANFDCSATGFSLQAMDSSQVALVALLLRAECFEHYRCDRNFTMGMNLGNMAKILRCASNDDIVTVKADDGTETVTFMFESPSQDKIADFEMKLMEIDSANLGIPEASFAAIVRMPAAEYARICRDLSAIGDTVMIYVTKEGVKFSTRGDIGTANIFCRKNLSTDKPEDAVIIDMQQPVSLTFALRYMNYFAKATPLATQVTISLSSDQPLVVEYKIAEVGHLRFYLAPKIDEDEESAAAQPESKPKMENPPPESEVEPIVIDGPEHIEEDKAQVVKLQPKSEVEPILVEDSEHFEEIIKHEKKTNGEAKHESFNGESAEVMDIE